MSSSRTATTAESGKLPGNCTLEDSLNSIVDVFHQYSIRRPKIDYLNFGELQTLMKEQAPTFLQACGRNNPSYLNKLYEETDLNHDKEVSFEEFTIVLAKLTNDAHHIIHHENRCVPDKD